MMTLTVTLNMTFMTSKVVSFTKPIFATHYDINQNCTLATKQNLIRKLSTLIAKLILNTSHVSHKTDVGHKFDINS